MLNRLHRAFFYVLVFLIPLNLGKHFVTPASYVHGLLVDYLIPTVYVQDVIVLFLLSLQLLAGALTSKKSPFAYVRMLFGDIFCRLRGSITGTLLVLLLYSLLLSTLLSPQVLVSLTLFVRVGLYLLLAMYVKEEVGKERPAVFLSTVAVLLGISAVFQGTLAFGQVIKQRSVFSNYLFFGEQPYSFATPGIAKESVFGRVYLPPYGTFRHPNVLGGFLSIALMLLLYLLDRVEAQSRKYSIILVSFAIGLAALVLTLSVTAWSAFLLGSVLLFSAKLLDKRLLLIPAGGLKIGSESGQPDRSAGLLQNSMTVKLHPAVMLVVFGLFIAIFVTGLSLPLIKQSEWGFHLSNRSNFLTTAYKLSSMRPLFGVGFGMFPTVAETFPFYTGVVRFVQPVHNIFVLVLVENGLFSAVLFLLLCWSYLGSVARKIAADGGWGVHALGCVLFLQLVVLASFDHYLLTSQQGLLLFCLSIGIGLL